MLVCIARLVIARRLCVQRAACVNVRCCVATRVLRGVYSVMLTGCAHAPDGERAWRACLVTLEVLENLRGQQQFPPARACLLAAPWPGIAHTMVEPRGSSLLGVARGLWA